MGTELYSQGNTLTVRCPRPPGYKGVLGNGTAYAKKASAGRAPDKEDVKAIERISAAFLKRERPKRLQSYGETTSLI